MAGRFCIRWASGVLVLSFLEPLVWALDHLKTILMHIICAIGLLSLPLLGVQWLVYLTQCDPHLGLGIVLLAVLALLAGSIPGKPVGHWALGVLLVAVALCVYGAGVWWLLGIPNA